jgi:hypothetical protein
LLYCLLYSYIYDHGIRLLYEAGWNLGNDSFCALGNRLCESTLLYLLDGLGGHSHFRGVVVVQLNPFSSFAHFGIFYM